MTSEAVNYVRVLLDSEPGTVAHMIGWRLWMIPRRDEQIEYLCEAMQEYGSGTRGWEIAHDVWLLLGERDAAA